MRPREPEPEEQSERMDHKCGDCGAYHLPEDECEGWTLKQRNEAQTQLRARLVSLSEELSRIIQAFPDPSPDGLERLYTETDMRNAATEVLGAETCVGYLKTFLGLQLPTQKD